MHARRITLHGHSMAYRLAGRGPVVVLLHGMAGSSATWRHVMPALAERFTVLAPDLLGHGASAKPPGDYSLGAYASGVRDLMAALGHERATIVGQSFGGGVAMQLAYQFPERCERLVLVGSGGLGVEVNALLRALSVPGVAVALPIACRELYRDVGKAIARAFARRGRKAGPALVEIAHSYASLVDPAARSAFLQTLRAVVDSGGQRVSARDRLYLTADVPTMIVWGTHDPIIPVSHAHAAHAAIPGSRLELFERVGHYPHCEDPARFLDVLLDFVAHSEPARMSAAQWGKLVGRHLET